MSENPIQPRTLRSVTIELEPEVLIDNDTGAPIAVGEPRKLTGTLSPHWDEIIEQGAER